MKTREYRPAEAPFDPGALGVHRHVDHAPEKPRCDQNAADHERGPGVEQRTQRRPECNRAGAQDAPDAEAMRERPGRGHRDEIGHGIGGEQRSERGGIDMGARQN
jgi:hypothetical protein